MLNFNSNIEYTIGEVDGVVGQSYKMIQASNILAGFLSRVRESLHNKDVIKFKDLVQFQIGLIEEELQELKESLKSSDELEQLDAACDITVTALGLLNAYSMKDDAVSALYEVCDNNLSKFVSINHPNLQQIIQDTREKYKDQFEVEVVQHGNRVIFLRPDGKYVKPSIYRKVDLSSFLNKSKYLKGVN